jgi:hypothetical protein
MNYDGYFIVDTCLSVLVHLFLQIHHLLAGYFLL